MNDEAGLAQVKWGALLILSILMGCELLSVLNQQWGCAATLPFPTDFINDLERGLYIPTLLSTLIVLLLSLITIAWYQGGMKRVISNHFVYGAFVLLLAGVSITALFNAFMSIHITTIHEWLLILPSIQPHTKAYSRLWFSLLMGSLIPLAMLLFPLIDRLRQDNKALGNAHFATGIEIASSGVFKKEEGAIMIGKHYGVPLWSNGFEHVLVFASTGSGKTSSIAIPNLFQYPYSMVCNDLKLTLFKTTSGYREQVLGHRCYCWSLTNTEGFTHRYNPMSFISSDKQLRITDIQRMAHILIPDNNKEAGIWAKESRKLFKALTLYLIDTPERPTTLGEMNRLIKQEQFDTWLHEVLTETESYDPEFYRNGFSYLSAHEETRTSILISFSGYLELFDDPIVDAATSASDFDIRTLRREKTTIYIGYTDEDMERLSPILTLFWQQVISAMIKEIPDPIKEPYPLLCLIDEFSSLGRIERLRRSLKLLREYRVRCVLMFQYISQTYERYSHDEAKAFTNIKTKIAYGCDDLSDAEYISKMLGTRTKKIVSYSLTSQANGGVNEGKNINYQAIPLMRPDEIMRFKQGQSLIIRTGSSPIKASQFIWYKEPSMKQLVCKPTNVPQQLIVQAPFIHAVKNRKKTHNTSKCSTFALQESQELEWIDN